MLEIFGGKTLEVDYRQLYDVALINGKFLENKFNKMITDCIVSGSAP